MKISKTQLKQLIGCSGCCDWNCDPYKEEKYEHFKSRVLNSLWDDTLEIEGYERVPSWIKFDPDDPSTHPPCSAPVFGEPAFYLVRIHGQTQIAEWDNDYVAFLIDDYEAITHWRPTPQPPRKEEEK